MVSSVGITGHQARPGIDWDWVAAEIRLALTGADRPERCYSSIAIGADQVFAQAALELGLPLTAVIPLPDYDRFFSGDDAETYRSLRQQSEVIQLGGGDTDEEAFFAAGKWIADAADLLIAVWDGQPAAGLGGTGDVVAYRLADGRPVLHIDPIRKITTTLQGAADVRPNQIRSNHDQDAHVHQLRL